jgi:hypothetical protein
MLGFLYVIIDFLICKLKIYLIEEFEDTKGVIRVRKSKKGRQQNGQKKKGQKDKQRSTKHSNTNPTKSRG